jgi:methyl coenzyme M reductase alpha subunit
LPQRNAKNKVAYMLNSGHDLDYRGGHAHLHTAKSIISVINKAPVQQMQGNIKRVCVVCLSLAGRTLELS